MNKIQETNPCGRGEQLVAYLYGEATQPERAGFEQHLPQCAACRDELAAFTQVRESVGEWRAELLTRAPGVLAADASPAAAPARTFNAEPARRSAWGALREFFALSPAWLRFGSVAAALVVCALAALAVFNVELRRENGSLAVRTGVWRAAPAIPDAPQVAGDDNSTRLKQLIAERDAAVRQLEDARAQLEDSRAANIEAVYNEVASAETETATQPASGANRPRRAGGASAPRRSSARRDPRGEDDLPRLLDLIGGANE
jgi:anti-sigma factor RsiW